MTTVIVNKEKDSVKVYSDRLIGVTDPITGEPKKSKKQPAELDINSIKTMDDLPKQPFHDIKAIKVANDLILFSVGDMSLFLNMSITWRQKPEYFKKINTKDLLLNDIYDIINYYANISSKRMLYSLFIVSPREVLDLNIGLNINPEKRVSVIPQTYKINNLPQIYGSGKIMFNKPAKLGRMLKKSPKTVFENIHANPDLDTSKEFDILSIK